MFVTTELVENIKQLMVCEIYDHLRSTHTRCPRRYLQTQSPSFPSPFPGATEIFTLLLIIEACGPQRSLLA